MIVLMKMLDVRYSQMQSYSRSFIWYMIIINARAASWIARK
jgi:hypothetical protein